MTDDPRAGVRSWSIAIESLAAALLAYLVAGTIEFSLIRAYNPSERELAWVSDVILSAAFGVAVYLWRNLSATRRALLDREREELVLKTQLALAADLQRRLLPVLPAGDGRIEWAAALRSAGQIGGDFYDLVPFQDGRQMLLVADVSGKGIPAAMALSTLRTAFRAFARPNAGPAQVLTELSAALHEQWAGAPYLTGIVSLVDAGEGTLQYANAAHPSALLVGPRGTRVLESLGPPAALLPGTVYHERAIAIEPGDLCVFVSDGVTEALGDEASEGIESIMRNGEATPGSANDLCDSVMGAALRGTGPDGVADWDDDRTVVVMAVLDDGYEHARVTTGAGVNGAAP
ncbi:MAG TPA: PP2C family protein-serine/threonine phosphatase [Vicinamibacterales bacterium]|nr:PP2C family protein-serine/threonine phosphatase [Vicinamibacterales bacterium]